MGEKIERAIAQGLKICSDDSYGYSNKWPDNLFDTGNAPKDGDCGAFVSACWQAAGVFPKGQYFEPVGSGKSYSLYNEALLTKNGFSKIRYTDKSALRRGDILVSGGHTVMYLGSSRIMHARNDDDKKSGDGTGREVCEQAFYDNGTWCYVFRYSKEADMTDRERDIQQMEDMIGRGASYVKPIWLKFASGWDGAWCSEAACCVSYLAGNIDKIYVSNYCAGLVEKFKAAGRFGTSAKAGAFVFFDYRDGSGPSHTGRVIDVSATAITTMEGNINGTTVKRSYVKSSPIIYGYGYPAYDDDDTTGGFDMATLPDLKKGSKETKAVKSMQALLNMNMPSLSPIAVDGDFGTNTETRLKAFQKARSLTVDGWCGQYCWSALLL